MYLSCTISEISLISQNLKMPRDRNHAHSSHPSANVSHNKPVYKILSLALAMP